MTDIKKYQQRMQRKNAPIDSALDKADQQRGVVVLLTGNGKGKSSSALGMATRALGHGMRVGMVQFIKSWTNTGSEYVSNKRASVPLRCMAMFQGPEWPSPGRPPAGVADAA